MAKVLLVQCAGGERGGSGKPPLSTFNEAEPLGLLCLEASLKLAGHRVRLLHPNVGGKVVLSEEGMVSIALDYCADIVGFSAMTNQLPATARIASGIKKRWPEVPIVVGGDHFSSCPEDILKYDCFDYVVAGEGESAMLWLVENWRNGLIWKDVVPDGVYWKADGILFGSGNARRVSDINLLPRPSRHLGLLRRSGVGALMWPPPEMQTGMVSVYASSGCPYACSYCNARQMWGKGVRWRDVDCVVNELSEVQRGFGVNTAFFVDLTFNSDMAFVYSLCEKLRGGVNGVSWYVVARPGKAFDRIGLNKRSMYAMREAGCTKIGFGVETVSPAVAKALRRASADDHVIRVARWADELGVLTKAFIMIGHPDEDEAYYEKLVAFLEDLSVDEIRVSFLTPFPGSSLWKRFMSVLPGPTRYDEYTTFRPILPHPRFSAEELGRIREDILVKHYTGHRYLERVREKIAKYPKLARSFEHFFGVVSRELGVEIRAGGGGSLPISIVRWT